MKVELFGFVLILFLVGGVIAVGSSTGANSDLDSEEGEGIVPGVEVDEVIECVKCGDDCVTLKDSYVRDCVETTRDFECVYDGVSCMISSSGSDVECGNGVCEDGEANVNDPGGCGPDADPKCLGPPARFIKGSCPKDCGDVNSDEVIEIECEDPGNRRDRIKCRLDYVKENKKDYVAPKDSVPEACRNLENNEREGCRVIYKKADQCYGKDGKGKNKCFKRVANFANAELKDEKPNVRDGKAREYVVLLLYDIQEKIEHAIENGRVESGKGAEIIDTIVVIKELILKGEKKEVVKPLMRDLRVMLQSIRGEVNNE
ncbi:hypothetical protein CMI38_01645 [Candidatus Pacearchaeota archaeon]|nr:hypothetical protein [Candidatus Pacearchaeota archaeon]